MLALTNWEAFAPSIRRAHPHGGARLASTGLHEGPVPACWPLPSWPWCGAAHLVRRRGWMTFIRRSPRFSSARVGSPLTLRRVLGRPLVRRRPLNDCPAARQQIDEPSLLSPVPVSRVRLLHYRRSRRPLYADPRSAPSAPSVRVSAALRSPETRCWLPSPASSASRGAARAETAWAPGAEIVAALRSSVPLIRIRTPLFFAVRRDRRSPVDEATRACGRCRRSRAPRPRRC